MKKVLIVLCGMCFVMTGFALSGCAMAQRMKEGTVEVTPLANKQYDIWAAGGIVSNRSALIKKWEDAANETCHGNYEITKEQTTGQSPGGSMTIEGRIRCK